MVCMSSCFQLHTDMIAQKLVKITKVHSVQVLLFQLIPDMTAHKWVNDYCP